MKRHATTMTVPCGCCRGTGRIPFTGVHADTLALLRQQLTPVSGAELGRIAGCTGMAMCNRLRALGRLGFATSTRYGVKRLWRANT